MLKINHYEKKRAKNVDLMSYKFSLRFLLHIVCACMCIYPQACTWIAGTAGVRTTFRSQFSPSTMWSPEIRLVLWAHNPRHCVTSSCARYLLTSCVLWGCTWDCEIVPFQNTLGNRGISFFLCFSGFWNAFSLELARQPWAQGGRHGLPCLPPSLDGRALCAHALANQ